MESKTDPNSFAHNPALRRFWYPVALAAEVNPGPVPIKLLNQHYVLWNAGSETEPSFSALPDRCPHREAPLSAGCVDEGSLSCAYHGWEFAGDGACLRVPSNAPGVPVPPKAHLQPLAVQERYGVLWLCPLPPAEAPPASGLPCISQEADASFRRLNMPTDVWQCSVPRIVDNFMDFSHFPFVHVGTIGNSEDTVIPTLELGELEGNFYGYQYEVTVSNPEAAQAVTGEQAAVLHRSMTTGFCLPSFVRTTIAHPPSDLLYVLLLLTAPRDDYTSYYHLVMWRNDDFSVPAEEIFKFERVVTGQDKAMQEQVKGLLPLDLTGTVSVQADKPSVEWRRQFVQLLESADAS